MGDEDLYQPKTNYFAAYFGLKITIALHFGGFQTICILFF